MKQKPMRECEKLPKPAESKTLCVQQQLRKPFLQHECFQAQCYQQAQ